MTWKTVTAPKTMYLPVRADDGTFKNSGMRIEPADKVELLPRSNRVRVNGVEYSMMVSCDNIRVNDQGIIQLDKPRPPARLSTGGDGQAWVGRPGVAAAAAREHATVIGGETDAAASQHRPDAFPIQLSPDASQHATSFDQEVQEFFGPPDETTQWSEAQIQKAFEDPNTDIEEITLRDGSKAFIRIDKRTGNRIGTPFRPYQATFDDQGRQVGVPLPYTGPRAPLDAYRTKIQEQAQDAKPARTGHDIQDRPQAFEPRPNALPPYKAVTTGAPHLDALIGGKRGQCLGFPFGYITWLQGPIDLRQALLAGARAVSAPSLTHALGQALIGKDPLIVVAFETFDDPTKLQLAEDIPDLFEQITKQQPNAAIVIATSDDPAPKNLKFFCGLHIALTPYDGDSRRMTAHIHKTMVSETHGQHITFPIPSV